jgi:predicted ester cyclase
MLPDSLLAELDPAAYAPYRDPRDFILSWTDAIWIDRGLGRLTEHYATDVQVHTAYGETYDWDHVVSNSLQKFAAFPNAGGGLGEDVIWESRGRNAFISSHRTIKSGTHTGYWTYGPPTGKHWLSRTVAHCLVVDNKVSEEWLVRDEWAVLEHLGLDPYRIAAELAEASPVLGTAMKPAGDADAFAGRIENAAIRGVSGERPGRHERECAMVQGVFEEVWNQRLFNRVPAYFDRQIVCQTTRMRRTQGIDPYQIELIDLLASFPDFRVEVRDIAVLDGPEVGLRIAVLWLMRGTYSGVPTYGPITRTPVNVLGISHFEVKDGKILREFRLVDEIAVLAQIHAGRVGAKAA